MQFDSESRATAKGWPLYRSYDVFGKWRLAGRENAYINNSSQKKSRAVGGVSLCLSCQYASTDMQHCLPVSFIRSDQLTWYKVKFSDWPFRFKTHVCRCVSKREIRRCFAFSLFFVLQKLLAETLILPRSDSFCLTYPGKVNMWPKVVK